MTYYRESDATREAGVTYHLVPASVWDLGRSEAMYTPEAYEADGFIHCTNGIDQLVTVANWFYVPDVREFRVLVLDVAKIKSEVRYDDEEEVFPHIYGPLNTDAVIGEFAVTRSDDGTFISIDQL